MTYRLVHEHVGKRAKMSKKKRKPNKWHEASKASLSTSHRARKVCIKRTNTTWVYLTSGYIQTSLRRDGCNHTSKWPLKTDKHKPTEGTKHGKA